MGVITGLWVCLTGCVSNTIVVEFVQNGPINSGTGGGNLASSRPLDVDILLVSKDERAKWGPLDNPNVKPQQYFDSARGKPEYVRSERLDADFGNRTFPIVLPEKFRNSDDSSIWIYPRYMGPNNETLNTTVIAKDHLRSTERIRVEVGPQALRFLSMGK